MKGPLGDPTAKYRVCIEFAETRTNASPVPLHLPRRADLVAISRGSSRWNGYENPTVPESSVLILLWKFIAEVFNEATEAAAHNPPALCPESNWHGP